MHYFRLNKFAQIEKFLQQQGYSPEFILFVKSKDKKLQKAIGKIINENRYLAEQQLRNIIDTLQSDTQTKTKVDPLASVFNNDADAQQQFFTQIPKAYHSFVAKILARKELQPEDLHTIKEQIETFENLKKHTTLRFERDINKYNSWRDWVETCNKYQGIDPNAVKMRVDPSQLKGTTLVDAMNNYKIWKITDPESLKDIGLGTKWCTRRNYKPTSQAERYLENYGSIFVITKAGNLFAQFTPDFDEMQNTDNVEIQELPKDLVLDRAIVENKAGLRFASNDLLKNKEFVIDVLKKNGREIEDLPRTLRNDRDIALAAVRSFSGALASLPKFVNDKEIVAIALQHFAPLYTKIGDKLRNDRDLFLMVVGRFRDAYQWAGPEIKNDRNMIMLALEKANCALPHAPAATKFNDDPEIVKLSLVHCPNTLANASDRLRNNEEIALLAIKYDSIAYPYVSQELRNSQEFVQKAIDTNGQVIGYVDHQDKNYRKLALDAIRNDPSNFQRVVGWLQSDVEFMIDAIRANTNSYLYMEPSQKDTNRVYNEFMLAVAKEKQASGWYRRIKF